MKRIKYLVCLLLIGALLVPYTAFAKNNTEYGYGEIKDISPSYYDAAFSLQSDDFAEDSHVNRHLSENEIEMLEYIALHYSEFNDKISGLEQFNVEPERFKYVYSLYISQLIQLEHPELFYVDLDSPYSYASENGLAASVSVAYTMNKEQAEKMQSEIDKEVNKIAAVAETMNTDLEKILYVHDYILSNYCYDTTYQSRTLDTMVSQKTGVCQGYAHLFYTVMKELSIPCINVPNIYNAEVESGHVWNKVQIDNEWFNIDLTYDDPISDFSNSSNHYYFLLNDDEIKRRDSETGQEKNEHVRMETKKWDGVHDIEPATADSTKYSGFSRITGATSYMDGKFWCLSLNEYKNSRGNVVYFNDICHVKFEENIVLEEIYTKARDYVWYIWDYDRLYIEGLYSGLVMLNNKLYFNSPNTVYEFNTESGELEEIYKYDKESNICNTYLYGLSVKDKKLYADYCEIHYYPEDETIQYENFKNIEITLTAGNSEDISEVFPEFNKPLPCTVDTPEITENKMVNEETQEEEVVSYNVSVDVTIPDEVTEKTEEVSKPVTVVVAQYDENGTFMGFAEEVIDESAQQSTTKSFTVDANCSSLKTFVWSGFIMPLAMAEAIGLTAPAQAE